MNMMQMMMEYQDRGEKPVRLRAFDTAFCLLFQTGPLQDLVAIAFVGASCLSTGRRTI